MNPLQTLVGSTPYTKLDTANIVSFQTIVILFDHEPTQPPAVAPYTVSTPIYQFAHGYSYISSIWAMWQNSSPESPDSPSSGNTASYFNAFGDDANTNIGYIVYNDSGAITQMTKADLVITADNINVYIAVKKTTLATLDLATVPLYLAGITLNLRIYCFTEPANTSSY